VNAKLGLLYSRELCGKIVMVKPMNNERKVQIFGQLIRHLTAIVYLIAELIIGEKPEKL
jgi:hypothetical protein